MSEVQSMVMMVARLPGRGHRNSLECEWFYLDASSSRRFRLGQRISVGERLGYCAREQRVLWAECAGEVAEIQFDPESNELILGVRHTTQGGLAVPCQ